MQKIAAMGIATLAVVGMVGFGGYTATAMQNRGGTNASGTTQRVYRVDGTGGQAQNKQRVHAQLTEAEREAMRAEHQADCDGTGMQQHQRQRADEE